MSIVGSNDHLERCDFALMRRVGGLLGFAGAIGAVVSMAIDPRRFAFAWLVACIFVLSLCFGSLFLVIVHHLFDAGWSVSVRRICEHLACIVFPWSALAFVPLVFLGRYVYSWGQTQKASLWESNSTVNGGVGFWVWFTLSVLFFGLLWWLSRSLRRLSLEQDKTGEPALTVRMRRYSAGGAFILAVTVTGAATLWMKGVDQGWASAIYGACFFSSCSWFATAVVWCVTILLRRNRALGPVLGPVQFQSLGALLLGFTLLHAYMHYSQYLVVWNANLPAETSWYVAREQGTWWYVGLALVFGHFLLPFLVLLHADWKLRNRIVLPVCVWAWFMHYLDIAFNILPVASPAGFPLGSVWMDLSCLALVGGCVSMVFARDLCRYPAFPLRDPRLNEVLVGLDRHCSGAASAGSGVESGISETRSINAAGI